jgi:hypothetical protein
MMSAFLEGLVKRGYTQNEYRTSGNTVLVLFKKPHSKQPLARRGLIGWIALRVDKRNVWRYRTLTKGVFNIVDVLELLKNRAPFLYERALNVGRPKKLYKLYDAIRPYLEQQ